jgi:hypothetical protein
VRCMPSLATVLLLSLAACGGSALDDTGAAATGTGGTGTDGTGTGGTDTTGGGTGTGGGGATEVTGEVSEAVCVGTDNALRFDCVASAEGALTWTVLEDGAPLRTFTTEGPDHSVSLYGLAARTDYTWEASGDAGSAAGALSTGALPSDLQDLTLSTAGTAAGFDHVVLPITCGSGWLLVADTGGRIVWYEEVTTSGGGGPSDGVSGFSVTDRGSFITAAQGRDLTEWSYGGGTLLEASVSNQHHDVHYSDGFIYALTEHTADGLTVDGFSVFDSAGTEVATWRLEEHVEVSGDGGGGGGGPGGGAQEWSHGNSIVVEGGRALMSLRWQNAVLELDANPDSPSFGEVAWVLVGDDADLTSDFRWTDGGGYVGQHHARWNLDGTLSLFDNGDREDDSRVLAIALDEGAMTASEAAQWSLGTHCDIQGAGFDLGGGNMLATCGDGGWAAAYDAAGAETWSLDMSCAGGDGRGSSAPRVRPLTGF